ncbi:MAG: hypothetical protein Q7T54_00095 [Candidatus Levybacteria bacterium]|nr:hypothetical protein [Candidatus Levybacteria bacterium]
METANFPQQQPIIPQAVNLMSYHADEKPYNNKTWTVLIPAINKSIFIISLLVLCLIDIPYLVKVPSLFIFFIPMVISILLFVVFLYIENDLKQSYKNSRSLLDILFVVLITIRNILFFLNVLPVIQILGIFAVGVLCIPYIIIYVFAIHRRDKASA